MSWFVAGLGVKRWFVPILLGTTLIGVGLGISFWMFIAMPRNLVAAITIGGFTAQP